MLKLAMIFLVCSLPCLPAIAYVQSVKTSKSNAGNPTASFSATPTVGNLVVAAVSCYAAANCNVSSITDNQGNTYSSVASNVAYFSTQATTSLYYAMAATASGTFTVTANLTASEESTLVIAEYSGIASAPLDISTSATGSSTLATATVTTTNANDLLILSAGVGGAGAAPTAGTSYTMRQAQGGLASETIGLEDRVVSSAGSQTATMNTPNQEWAAIIAAFKQSVAAPTILSIPRAIWIQ